MAKNEAKIKFTAGTSEFNDAIKKSNDELGELRAEVKLNAAQMKTAGTSVEGLQKQHDLLGQELKTTQEKTETLNQKLNKAIELYGENSSEAIKLKTQLTNTQVSEEKIKQAIQACNNELQEQIDVSNRVETATEKLSNTINQQKDDLEDLKKRYSDIVLEEGEASDEAQTLAREIESLSKDLKVNKDALSDASKKADELDKSFENVGDGASDAGEGFTVMKAVVADLASSAIQAAIGKISEFTSYLAELPAETLELRQDLSTLTTSFDEVGFSTETATQTWKDLYAVFGEDDRAVETANNISKIADSQQDLDKWTTITTGVFGKFQDSLPVESLAEASQETAKTGAITGALADALNWGAEEGEMFGLKLKENIKFTELSSKQLKNLTDKEREEYEAKKKQYKEIEDYNTALQESTAAEEKFQLALDNCSSEQERQELITNTLTRLYSESADTYRDTAESQMKAKEATAEQVLAEANLASAIEPVTTAFTELKTQLLTGVQPAVEKVSGVMTDALGWAKEHPVAMKAVGAAVGIVAAALGVLTGVVIAYTVAQWAMNSAILANPLTWIIMGVVAAIAAVVAAIIVVVEYWDEIVVACKNAWETVKSTLAGWGEWINTNVIQPIADFFKGLWEGITEKASTAWDGVKTFFAGIPEWFDTTVIQPVINFFKGLWEGIKNTWETAKNFFISISEWFDTTVIQPVINLFKSMWQGIQEAWDFICNIVQVSIMLIGSILSAAFQIITIPFRFIWENCKEYIIAVWSAIKSAVSTAINAVKDVITTVFNAVKNFIIPIWNSIKSTITTVVNTIKDTVTKIWNSIKTITMTVFNAIKSAVTKVWNDIKSAITTVVNTIKDTVTKIWNSIKTTTTTVFNAVKSTVTKVWNSIKSAVTTVVNAVKSTVTNVWNGIKSTTSSVFNSVKSVASSAWNSLKNTVTNVVNGVKSNVTSVWNGIKSTTSSVFNSVKSTATSVWNGVKTAITKPIEAAKNKVKSVVDAIKGFFKGMKLSLPNIKLPHFSITGKLSIDPPSVPKLSIKWYKEGAIFAQPTLFNTPFGFKGLGEAGPEAVLPIDKLEGYVENAIERTMHYTNLQPLIDKIEDLSNRPIQMNINGREFAQVTASDSDIVNGLRSSFIDRGLVLD